MHCRERSWRKNVLQILGEKADSRAEALDVCGDVEPLVTAAKEPDGGPLEKLTDLDEHLDLQIRRHLVVEMLDRFPGSAQIERVANDRVRSRNVGSGLSGFFHHPPDEGRPDPVHHRIGYESRDDLPAQTMPLDR
jgi:hypothetical protein